MENKNTKPSFCHITDHEKRYLNIEDCGEIITISLARLQTSSHLIEFQESRSKELLTIINTPSLHNENFDMMFFIDSFLSWGGKEEDIENKQLIEDFKDYCECMNEAFSNDDGDFYNAPIIEMDEYEEAYWKDYEQKELSKNDQYFYEQN